MADKTWKYHVWFRKYGKKQPDGSFPILEERDQGEHDVPDDIEDTEEYLEEKVGKPPKGFTMDFKII